MLPKYMRHVESNPETLLTRFYGVHRVKPSHGRKVGTDGVLYWSGFVDVSARLLTFAATQCNVVAHRYTSSNCPAPPRPALLFVPLHTCRFGLW